MVDYNEPAQKVRLLIGDLDTGENQIFDGDQLNGFLTIADGSIKRAAADAIDVIASSEALISKVITTQDRSVDGSKTADALRKHAASLRQRAKEEEDLLDEEPYFMAFSLDANPLAEGEERRYDGRL
ncbi:MULTISPECIES: hypothetical protein [unclassified Brevibacterium]|uniref:hypothetical protein n=1 Tax=unclassified Brevibacterium TaxID=2614124 RepID=UPI001E477782|nr:MULTISPECIES: hypothetical protein [unclassified Brevibacterium]MCD1287336.1 hypothetical protein [Brevibacterium sp. CCUG 69071]MDK8436409.1 hypothetical protein [Brevibacterium sp. H-BE7]